MGGGGRLSHVSEHALDFLKRGVAGTRSLDSNLAQCPHSRVSRGALKRLPRGSLCDEFRNRRRDDRHLVHGETAAIPGVPAGLASDGPHRGRCPEREGEAAFLVGQLACGRTRTFRAHAPDQSLCDGAAEAGGDGRVVESEIQQSRDRAHRVVRMQRRQHEMARQRGLRRHVRGFGVANLAHEDHVGILTEYRAQRGRERHVAFRFHLHLRDSRQLVFHRVLDRHDVGLAGGKFLDRGIERRGLPRARRAGHDYDPVTI